MSKPRVVVMANGQASTFEELVKADHADQLGGAKIVGIITSNKDAEQRAVRLRVSHLYVSHPDDAECQSHMLSFVDRVGADTALQTGWISETSAALISHFRERLMGQFAAPLDPDHREPGVVNDFGGMVGDHRMHGMKAHCAVVAYHWLQGAVAEITEACVHHVTPVQGEGGLIRVTPVFLPTMRDWRMYADDDKRILSDSTLRGQLVDAAHELRRTVLPHQYRTTINAVRDLALDGRTQKYQRTAPFAPKEHWELLVTARYLGVELFLDKKVPESDGFKICNETYLI